MAENHTSQTAGYLMAGQGASTAPKLPSLMDDASGILNRLVTLLGHIQSIADKLNGGQPRAIEETPKQPEPVPSLRRQIDLSRVLLGKIEDEVQAIDARL